MMSALKQLREDLFRSRDLKQADPHSEDLQAASAYGLTARFFA
jgi:hypothetical protein